MENCNSRHQYLVLFLLGGYFVPWFCSLVPSFVLRRVWTCGLLGRIFLDPDRCGQWEFQVKCVLGIES